MNLIRIKSREDIYWNKAWEIYNNSFPLFERRTIKNQLEVMKNNNFNCIVIINYNSVIGILFYWELDKYIYIEHFAIEKEHRGRNYGSSVLRKFEKTNKIIILEIDPPIDEISKRRLNFYSRLGFKLNDYKHYHLSFRKNHKPYLMKVLSYNKPLLPKEFKNFLYYQEHNIMYYSEK